MCSLVSRARELPRLLLCCLLWLAASMAQAAVELPREGSLVPHGAELMLLREGDTPLSLEEVRRELAAGAFRPGDGRVPAFGIGSAPVWLHLALRNPHDAPRAYRLLLGTAWIDRLDIWLVQDETVVHLRAGDGERGLLHPIPGQGYAIDHRFAPGVTGLFVRAQTDDPLLLPLQVQTAEAAARAGRISHYSYGFLYGFLLALIAYNALLYAGLRQRSYRNYALYLGAFVILNLAYTGHGYALLWPDAIEWQRWAILLFMVLFACAGTRFAIAFLQLDQDAPRLARNLGRACAAALLALLLAATLGAQAVAALVAFTVVTLFSLVFVLLGWRAWRHAREQARYFLVAALSALMGVAPTTLTVWGFLPYYTWTFRAVEFGLLVEATVLALAVAWQVRNADTARHRAERLASLDPLTGLLNRRAFLQQGEHLLEVARRDGEALTIVLVELTRHAQVRQDFGQTVADWTVRETARLVNQVSRSDDPASRWGEDTFALLLPRSNHLQARAVAERICTQLAIRLPALGLEAQALQPAFGVAEFSGQPSIEALLQEAQRELAARRR